MRMPLCFLAAPTLAPACKASARSDESRHAASSSASAPAASLYDLTVQSSPCSARDRMIDEFP
jgi:hypothetical protein